MGYSLDLLKQIAHGLAQQFSDSCEIVIHDVRHGIENTILYIENGHVTDRKSGDSASNVVLEAIKADPSTLQDHRIPPSHPLPAVQPLRLRTMSPSFWIP